MIDAHILPKPPSPSARATEPAKKTAMSAAAATQGVLAGQPSESDHDVEIRFVDSPLSEPSEAPQAKSPSQRDDRNAVSNDATGRLHPVLAAIEMNFMSEITQTYGSLK